MGAPAIGEVAQEQSEVLGRLLDEYVAESMAQRLKSLERLARVQDALFRIDVRCPDGHDPGDEDRS